MFYARLARIQEQLFDQHRGDRPGPQLARLVPGFMADVMHLGPSDLAAGLESLPRDEPWGELIDGYWKSGGREPRDGNDVRGFVIEAVLQPFAEVAAHEARNDPANPTRPAGPTRPTCPACGGLPLLAVLREEGHGSRRSLLCGLCLSEWAAMRLTCATCGEATFDKLPVFRAEQFEGVRIDVCESCLTYQKTIDLSRDGSAVPLVDDLATLPLDLWARENGYRRARPNLLRL